MKAALNLACEERAFYLNIGKFLQKCHQVELTAVTTGRRLSDTSTDNLNINIENISDFIKDIWESLDPIDEKLEQLENSYSIDNLSHFILADRFLVNMDYDFSRRFLLAMFYFWEYYFDKHKPDIFISHGIDSLICLVRFHVARSKGVDHYSLFSSRYPYQRFAISVNNYLEQWAKLNDRYSLVLKNKLTQEQRKEAEEFLTSFRNKGTGPEFYKTSVRYQPRLSFWHIKTFLHRFNRYFFTGWRKDPFDILSKNPFWYAFRDIRRIILSPFHARLFFEEPKSEEKFVLYPLHFQPEANTLIMAPYLVNQIAVVENIAKSLPVNHKLYVKEHFSSIGRRKASYYKELKKIPNVRLINPFISSHKLIKDADLIITIASTAGWEGLLYEKPVILMGNTFYGASELCYKMESINELPKIIKKAITSHQPDRERLLGFIHSLLTGTYPGRAGMPHVDPNVLDPANMKLFADGIWEEFNRLKNRADESISATPSSLSG